MSRFSPSSDPIGVIRWYKPTGESVETPIYPPKPPDRPPKTNPLPPAIPT